MPEPSTRIPKPSRRRSRLGGSSIIELALALAILVNLAFGMVEFGYCFFVKNMMEEAAREGARNAIIAGSTLSGATGVSTSVSNVMTAAGFTASTYSVTYKINGATAADPTTATTNQAVTVTVSATWSVIGAGFRPMQFISGSKTISGVAVMRHL